ncbi:MAG: hypothetical protein AAGF47_12695 [Planctomycetota bacterium]
MTGTLFGNEPDRDEHDRAIVDAYQAAGRTLDDLPYTAEFERLMASLQEHVPDAEHRATFHRLHNLRKAGKLPRLGRADSSPPRLDYDHEQQLVELVAAETGSLGQRDRLPYTDGFDRVAATFNIESGLSLSHHDLWRVIAKLAK